MKFSENILTDYLNGELPIAQREALELQLSSDLALQASLDDLRATSQLLQKAFADEASLLDNAPLLAKNILSETSPSGFANKPLPKVIRWTLQPLVLGGIAACLVFLLVPILIWIYPKAEFSTDNSDASSCRLLLPALPPSPASQTTTESSEAGMRFGQTPRFDHAVPEEPVITFSHELGAPAMLPQRREYLNLQSEVTLPAGEPGYAEITALAGTRMRTSLHETGAAISDAVAAYLALQDEWPGSDFRTDAFDNVSPKPFKSVQHHPLSTFSIDVDTASYAIVRQHLNQGVLPPAGAVRIEELINYFPYDYHPPLTPEQAFSLTTDATEAPWQPDHHLVRIALKGYEIPWEERPPGNLVFLVDSSGSMNAPNRLPLVKKALLELVNQLDERDRVAIVTYAGQSSVIMPSSAVKDPEYISSLINRLTAGGATRGSSGIKDAYQIARENFIENGTNRIILCTDGDFNLGLTNRSDLVDLIRREAQSGVFLSILGFGMGNYKDATLEQLSNHGNGNYAYIDSQREARKALSEQVAATLLTIATDVKIQVEFNPAMVEAYRLLGYENRLLAPEDFRDDRKDAGEVGSGHSVTALYEVVPVGTPHTIPEIDPLKYQDLQSLPSGSSELLTVKVRYKKPGEDHSRLIEKALDHDINPFALADSSFRTATAAAAFGMLLRSSPETGGLNWSMLQGILERTPGDDPGGHRKEFQLLVAQAGLLSLKNNAGLEPDIAIQ